jgi:hypothetical protein
MEDLSQASQKSTPKLTAEFLDDGSIHFVPGPDFDAEVIDIRQVDPFVRALAELMDRNAEYFLAENLLVQEHDGVSNRQESFVLMKVPRGTAGNIPSARDYHDYESQAQAS